MRVAALSIAGAALACSSPRPSTDHSEPSKGVPVSPPPTTAAPALRWERVTPDHGLGAAVRPPAFAAVLGHRMFVALADAHNAASLFAAGADGVPGAVGAIPIVATGLCAAGDHLVVTGARVRDARPVVLEVDTSGKVILELELPIAGALHRAAQPVCTSAGVRVVWEERGPGNASTLMWSELAGAALGPVHSHTWPDRTVGFAPAADGSRVILLRDGGHPAHSLLHRFGGGDPEQTLPLPAFAVANPVGAADRAAVLLVPEPQTLQLAMVEPTGALGARLTVLGVSAPRTIDGGLLISGERGVLTVAVASGGEDPASETPTGEPVRREDYTLVACDAQAAGPAQPIEQPLAGAWLDGRLVLWTGRAGAVVSTWRLVQ